MPSIYSHVSTNNTHVRAHILMCTYSGTHKKFKSNLAYTNRNSMIGKNVNYITWQYDVTPKMCRGTYATIAKLITI